MHASVRVWQNPLYVMDFVVIFGALFFELTSFFPEGALLVLVLCWRVLRVIHGVLVTYELQEKARHIKMEADRQKTLKSLVDMRCAPPKGP
jgi:hypothetical protein